MKIYVLIHEQDTESAWGSHVSLFLNRDLAEASMRKCWEDALKSWEFGLDKEMYDDHCWEYNHDNAAVLDGMDIERWRIEEQDLAKILIGILNWGENLVKREEHREIRMKITGVKNQLILECLTSSGRQNPMSRKLFRGLVKKYNGKIQEKKEKTGKFGLTVILSRQVIL